MPNYVIASEFTIQLLFEKIYNSGARYLLKFYYLFQATDETFPGAILLVSAGLIGLCLCISIYFLIYLRGQSMKDKVLQCSINTDVSKENIMECNKCDEGHCM